MEDQRVLGNARVRDNGLYDGAWRYTIEIPACPWRLHVAPALGETLWLHEPGDTASHERRTALVTLPETVRALAEKALAVGPPSTSKHRAV